VLLAAPLGVLPGADADAAGPYNVLALGDSVPAGKACDCTAFPEIYGSLLSKKTGEPVTVRNRAVSGLDTGGLLDQLRSAKMRNTVARSDVILVTIGANDFGDHHDQIEQGQCGSDATDCVSDELRQMRAHLVTILAKLRALRHGAPTTILVTGYWNVFEDGDVARQAYGTTGLRASLRLTRRVNKVIHRVTDAAGDRYVNLFRPFEREGRDVTALMASDGNHPDARGHRLIAHLLMDAGLPL